jgi:hypothetical protein
MRSARAGVATAVAVGACLIAVAGCGGGGGDSSTAARTGAQFPALTSPNQSGSGGSHPGEHLRTGTSTVPITTSPGVKSFERVLAPFRDCLTRHGVQPQPFGSAARQQNQDPAQARREIQARIACIPELPPRLRKAAERLKSRYEQRQHQG